MSQASNQLVVHSNPQVVVAMAIDRVTLTFRCAAVFATILLLCASVLAAANSVPAGTILPVRLNSTLSSAKCKPGQNITARVMQDVPLPDGSTIRAGAKVVGHVTSIMPASNGAGASISLRFDSLKLRHGNIPITINLRAIASFVDVEQAQIPATGPDRGTSDSSWTTVQIGGDAVYRGGGWVEGSGGKVGKPVYNGVLSRVDANPDRGCRGALDSNNAPQALWVFSSDACGTYGLPNLQIREAGRSNPLGEIVLAARKGQLKIEAGAGLLLRVNPSSTRS